MRFDIYFDGSCHNTGAGKTPMGIGIYARQITKMNMMGRGTEWVDVFKYGFNAGLGTNNIAEWIGLREAMILAGYLVLKSKATEINIYSDSQLVVRQFRGDWRIKSENFFDIYDEVKKLEESLKSINSVIRGVFWVPRELNTEADLLSREGRDPGASTQSLLELKEIFKTKFLIKF